MFAYYIVLVSDSIDSIDELRQMILQLHRKSKKKNV